jgi:ERCC4-type nuclease
MIIKVDIRESALLLQMQMQISLINVYKSIKLISEILPIGDIIISDENTDKIIIERKSINDLLSSIKDGRYEEQSYRLNGLNHHNHNIIYLIEGDINKIKTNLSGEKQKLYSAMFSLNYYKGFSVFRSFNIEETANIICNMAYKLEKNSATKKAYYFNNKINTQIIESNFEDKSNDEQFIDYNEINEINKINKINEINENKVLDKNYVNVVKKIKKDNITPDNIGEIMLCQIPGISSITALAVMEKYKTIPNLIKELEIDCNSMKDLSYINSKGQVRKINKTIIDNIKKFLITNNLHP